MATLSRYLAFDLAVDGQKLSGGSRSAPEEITVDGIVKDATKSLTDSTVWDFWIVGADEAITSSTGWDYFYISADRNVLVEFVCDTGNEVGRVVFAKEVASGIPWDMTSDDAMANHTVDFATGTEDVIDAIRIKNASGQTATIRAVLIT